MNEKSGKKKKSQSDCWPTNYRYKFHCSHKTLSKWCIQNTRQRTSGSTPKRKDKKLKKKHSTKKTTIETQRKKKKKRKKRREKNQQFVEYSRSWAHGWGVYEAANGSAHNSYRNLWHSMDNDCAQWVRTKPTRLSFPIQRRANECERKHRIIEPIPEPVASGCATATAITRLLPLGGAQDKDRVVFMRFAVSFSVSHFLRRIVCLIACCLGFSRRPMYSALLIGNFFSEIIWNFEFPISKLNYFCFSFNFKGQLVTVFIGSLFETSASRSNDLCVQDRDGYWIGRSTALEWATQVQRATKPTW